MCANVSYVGVGEPVKVVMCDVYCFAYYVGYEEMPILPFLSFARKVAVNGSGSWCQNEWWWDGTRCFNDFGDLCSECFHFRSCTLELVSVCEFRLKDVCEGLYGVCI